jgi:4a-hydroxytetrahydrobiopterin dehydratase
MSDVPSTPLTARHCRRDAPRLDAGGVQALLAQLPPGWALEGDALVKRFRFPDFAAALAFVNRVAAVAEAEDHHPDVELAWGRAVLRIWTHAAGGLTENDFILAARADGLAGP